MWCGDSDVRCGGEKSDARLCTIGCGDSVKLGGVRDDNLGDVSRLMSGGLLLKPTHLEDWPDDDEDATLATGGDDDMTDGVEEALDAAIGASPSSESSSSVSVRSMRHTSFSGLS